MDEYLIYPKQFQRVNIPIDRNRCFVIMPFKDDLDIVYGTIKKELNKAGYICNRVDEVPGSIPIINKILTEMLRSRYIIADLTDCNPNVFYELGIAHSFKDASNIIILKQSDSKVPFDITHLTYIEYDAANPKYLTSAILKNISQYNFLADFHEALNVRGIISFISENGNYFIEFLKAELGTSLTLLTKILLNEIKQISEQDVDDFLTQYELLIRRCITTEQSDILAGVLRVYQEVMISCAGFRSSEKYVSRYLDGSFFSKFNLQSEATLSWATDMAIALAKSQKMLAMVLPWIIRYFSQTKTATIDLNRYKLEAFLMTSEHPDVNEMICNAVFDRNCYIREHMADIIGEKRLFSASKNLCKQLRCEDNYYSAISIMEALGKLNESSAIPIILEWLKTHSRDILQQQQYFVLKHARIVLVKLSSSDDHFVRDFDKRYGKYIEDYFYL